MRFSRLSGAVLPEVVRVLASPCLQLKRARPARTALLALSGFAALMMLSTPSHAATLLIDGSQLIFTGDANVSATALTWLCNRPGDPSTCAAGSGDFAVTSSSGTFAEYNNTFGRILDISQANQPIGNAPFATLPNFITFLSNNNITIDLNELPTGTKTASATCAGIDDCTPTNALYFNAVTNPESRSAFNLDFNTTSQTTIASFSFFGTVHDNTPGNDPSTANFVGTFSATLAKGLTPADVVAAISTGGLTQGYSENGTLTINFVPEPMTMSLMGAGLLAIGLLGRRKTRLNR